MKMVKSLILGTAVAFAATAGAQAADLPVKAKPVSYVKICPQYGPGFYYIPGTDICLKVGGLVFAEAGYHSAGAITTLTGAGHTESELNWRARGYVSLDARTATPYGTLRSFILGGFQQRNNLATGAYVAAAGNPTGYGVQADGFIQYAFIQFAGFTAGTANSFFDFGANYMTTSVTSNPWTWTNVFAYTANLGNGLSATISLEDASTTRMGNNVATVAHYTTPDVVANLRLDQAWGSAQLMAAAHQTRLSYDSDWGWAVGAGVEIKLPMLGAGDTLKIVGVKAEGATSYTGIDNTPNGAIGGVALGFDGFTAPAGTFVGDHNIAGVPLLPITLSDSASVMVQYRHFWTPTVRSAFHAGYNEVYNRGVNGFGGVQIVQYGANIAWSPVKDLTLSLDVLYTEIDMNQLESDRVATWFRVTRTF